MSGSWRARWLGGTRPRPAHAQVHTRGATSANSPSASRVDLTSSSFLDLGEHRREADLARGRLDQGETSVSTSCSSRLVPLWTAPARVGGPGSPVWSTWSSPKRRRFRANSVASRCDRRVDDPAHPVRGGRLQPVVETVGQQRRPDPLGSLVAQGESRRQPVGELAASATVAGRKPSVPAVSALWFFVLPTREVVEPQLSGWYPDWVATRATASSGNSARPRGNRPRHDRTSAAARTRAGWTALVAQQPRLAPVNVKCSGTASGDLASHRPPPRKPSIKITAREVENERTHLDTRMRSDAQRATW